MLFQAEIGVEVDLGRFNAEKWPSQSAITLVSTPASKSRIAQVCRLCGTPHNRHFYASALIAGGASVKQVEMVLGYASAVVTLRTYAHLWPGDDDRTRAIMDAVLSPHNDSARTETAP